MKKLLLLPTLFLLSFCVCQAQFIKSIKANRVINNPFADSLTKIITDFKYDYKSVQGNNLPGLSQDGMEAYKSKVTLPGAIHNTIYRFHSSIDTTASWQAVFYEGDSYKEAATAYKELYRTIKNSSVKWVDKSQIGFSGQLVQPRETLRFTLSTLTLDVIDQPYRTFVIEVEMINSFEGWEVHMNLQNKRNDTDR